MDYNFSKLWRLDCVISFTNVKPQNSTRSNPLLCRYEYRSWREGPAVYKVIYSGGSLPTVKGGEDLRLQINAANLTLWHKKEGIVVIPANAITDLSYGQEVHRRVGTAIGLAVVSFGIGAMMLLAKSKKHYIGMTWDDEGKKGGVALQADKNEYRGLIAAMEGITGKKAVNTDQPK